MTRSLDVTNIFRFVFAKCLPPQDAADRLLPPEHAAERALPPQDATKRARGVIVVEIDQNQSGFENDQRATTKPQIAQREKGKHDGERTVNKARGLLSAMAPETQ